MPAGRGGQKQAIADGNLILPTDFRTFCYVNIFRHTFCFRLKRLYLCISKGSAGVLPFFCFLPVTDDNSAQTVLPNGLFHFATRPERASKYGPFGLSFGLSENFDGPDEANETDGNSQQNGCEKKPCKVFSKDLIVRAIGRASPGPSEGGEGLAGQRLSRAP